jgi:DNA repair exonuclease SbcCD ATPase subunit
MTIKQMAELMNLKLKTSETPLSDETAALDDPVAMYIRSAEFEKMLSARIVELSSLAMKNSRLETENAELKRQLSVAHQDYRELSDAAVRVTTERDSLKAENIRITKLRDHDFEELAELAELRRQLAEGPVCGPCEHKRARAFLERQIAEGELIPLDAAFAMTIEAVDEEARIVTRKRIKEYAKRVAGAK